ncbi:MAG: hypothetical protein HON98_10725 [Chloroflexi bacterium]|jgi:myo-inositol-1(or 4)-monophosphatase|nr:hypothetical protein [Chloroflexota bacterium]MBT3670694.1 hypothetical protein [Chloroflexota bacterium]MBT4532849.1 hypothetical protein [Chloroflexota bacterium]MBT4756141.1 hypothetical protein [Chloroflexota bacterium]MBT6358576.1 hypothetical protein [Chloroflexota bacterium]
MHPTLQFATQTALKTGEILSKYFSLSGLESRFKADHTVVTEADLAADEFIKSSIKVNYPKDLIITEESAQEIDHIDQPIWVIDPLDGTTNFSLGLPIWGISIARVVNQKPETAAIYFPRLNELYSSQLGEGAELNGNKISTKGLQKNSANGFFTCCTRTHRNYNISVPYKTRIFGSAAYDLCAVARGSAIVGFQATPKIWDIAAGWLLIQESGGVVEVMDGPEPFPLEGATNYNERSFPTIMAADLPLAQKMREYVQHNNK